MNDYGRADAFLAPLLWSPDVHGDRCFYYDVFVSHARHDGSEPLVALLRDCGLRVWYDAHQEMNDIRWSQRIIYGLRTSRSILCVIGTEPLEDHWWSRAEIETATLAAAATGVERIFLAHLDPKQAIPTWLRAHPVWLRSDAGPVSRAAVEVLAGQLRGLNRVANLAHPRPDPIRLERRICQVRDRHAQMRQEDPLLRRLDAFRSRRQDASWAEVEAEISRLANEEGVTESPRPPQCSLARMRLFVDRAFLELQESTKGETGAESQMDYEERTRITRALYEMRCAFDALWPPPTAPLEDREGEEARILSEDLELLAALPLNADRRGCAHVALDRLATAGVSHAFIVAQNCLRWETNPELVRMLSRTLSESRSHQDRASALLVILKSAVDEEEWPFEQLADLDGSARLLQAARVTTAAGIDNLFHSKRRDELVARMIHVCRAESLVEVETTIRDAEMASGLISRGSGLFSINPHAATEACSILSHVVAACAASWPLANQMKLWKLPLSCVFRALAVAEHAFGGDSESAEAKAAFLRALAIPINEDALLLGVSLDGLGDPDEGDDPDAGRRKMRSLAKLESGDSTALVVELAELEISRRRSTLRQLGGDVYVLREGASLDARVYSADFHRYCDTSDAEFRQLERRCACARSLPSPDPRVQRVFDVALEIVRRWQGIAWL